MRPASFSHGLAARGARIAGHGFAAETSRAADRGAGAPTSSPERQPTARFDLTLAEPVQVILLLAARAAGVTPGELIARAIPFYASEAIGLPGLAGDLTRVPAFEAAPRDAPLDEDGRERAPP